MKNFRTYFTLIIFIIFTKNQILTNDLCISQIPIETKVSIFRLLPEKDFLNARCVCHEWEKVCQITGIEKVHSLSHKKLDQEQGKKLVNLPFSILTLDNCILEHEALLILSQSSKYIKLDLNNTKIGNNGFRMLTKGNLTSLTSLSVSNDWIRYPGIMSLVTGNMTSLISLGLNNDTIGDPSIRALVTGKNFTSLKSLDLSGNSIGDDGGIALTAGNFPSLKSLDLSGNSIGDDVKQKLKDKFPIEIKF